MYILSHDRFADVAHFDPTTGALEEFRRGSEPGSEARMPEGHYARLEGMLVAVFYRFDSHLWLRIGDQFRDLDAGDAGIRLEHLDGGRSRLTLLDHEEPCAAAEYEPVPFGGPDDPTPLAEPEHGDFGLFVKNVLDDEGRRARIYGGKDDGS